MNVAVAPGGVPAVQVLAEAELVVCGTAPAAARVLAALDPPTRRRATCLLLGEPGAGDLDAGAVVLAPDVHPDAEPAELAAWLSASLPAGATVLLEQGERQRDVAGWLAGAVAAHVAWDIEGVGSDGTGFTLTRLAGGGRAQITERATPAPELRVGLVRTPPAAPEPPAATAGATARLSDALAPAARRLRPFAGPAPVDLATASTLVVVGRGIGEPSHLPVFRELAEALGGALGATRAVVDLGWLPPALQIGQTGCVVAPALYLGFGVSGAAQHVVAMRHSARIVAVNTDPDAPLCGLADIVIEADAVSVARELLTAATSTREHHEHV